MAHKKMLRRLMVHDIQRILLWMFNLRKRPSFLPLKTSERPTTAIMVKMRDTPINIAKLISKLRIRNPVLINERIPFDMLFDCILREGKYEDIQPSLDCVSAENLSLVPMADFRTVQCSGIFVPEKTPRMEIDMQKYNESQQMSAHDILALDVEKVKTSQGKELGRVSLVDGSGKVIYDKIIKPRRGVIDYLTKYSGLTKEIVDKGIDAEICKEEVLGLIGVNTIIVGHGIENDLESLQLYHSKIIDTAHLFSSPEGRKISLDELSKKYLKKSIHSSTHDSTVDALTCLELLSIKIQHVFRLLNPETQGISINARICNMHIEDLAGEIEKGLLGMVATDCKNIEKHMNIHKKRKDILWMLMYEADGKAYIGF
ncbi:hypothetical protein HK407_02g03550 [Ordospora pajunii]|uniref:uncharacterized protein n=1 Tax=Ordospora pajunii TaxID=3039483 RepID=UPI00295283CA|nr:uncharacterized protein HK407_02g03550 [Ordospora pajunii]KAH9411910.1 hypothetical protein HK407_02g03550 [Ordospora pajunii]